jgi:hypothetical protein
MVTGAHSTWAPLPMAAGVPWGETVEAMLHAVGRVRRLRRAPRGLTSEQLELALVDDPDRGFVLHRVRAWDRIRARLQAPALDRALVRGADPESGVALTLHARRLIAPDTRRQLAHSLRTAASLSETPIRRGVPVRAYGPHVFLARRHVCALADRLEQPDAVDLRGVALVRLLLTDGGGPLHHNRGADTLIAAAREALAALEPSTSR